MYCFQTYNQFYVSLDLILVRDDVWWWFSSRLRIDIIVILARSFSSPTFFDFLLNWNTFVVGSRVIKAKGWDVSIIKFNFVLYLGLMRCSIFVHFEGTALKIVYLVGYVGRLYEVQRYDYRVMRTMNVKFISMFSGWS